MASGLIRKTQAHSIIVPENKCDAHNRGTWGAKGELLPKIYMCMDASLYSAQSLDEDIQRRNLIGSGSSKIIA